MLLGSTWESTTLLCMDYMSPVKSYNFRFHLTLNFSIKPFYKKKKPFKPNSNLIKGSLNSTV